MGQPTREGKSAPDTKGSHPLPPPPLPPQEEALLDAYLRSLQVAGLRSAHRQQAAVRAYLAYLAREGLSVGSLPAGFEEDYRSRLLSGPPALQRSTVNNRIQQLRRFYRYLVSRGHASANPFQALPRLRSGRRLPRRILSEAQMAVLLDGWARLTARDFLTRSVVELQYGSGLRISDVAALRRCDLDEAGGWLSVSDVKAGGRRRRQPATAASLAAVADYLRHGYRQLTTEGERQADYLYPQRGETTLRALVNAALRRECARLGLPRISSHALRHAAATHLLRAGAGIREVQTLLGHRKIGSTQVYTHVVKEDLKRIVAAYHPREQPPSPPAE